MLEEKISDQEQQISQMTYKKERLDLIFKKMSSYLSNIIVKSAHLLKNMTFKMKISYPIMLGDLFKKYSCLEYIPADGGYGSPNESSASPSKKGSRMNVDGSY
jgi:hypothetical protein